MSGNRSQWESELSTPPITNGGFTQELANRIRDHARAGDAGRQGLKTWRRRFTGLAAAGAMSLAIVIGAGVVTLQHVAVWNLTTIHTSGAQASTSQPVVFSDPVSIDPPYRTIGPWTMMILTVENTPQLTVKMKYLGKVTAKNVVIKTPDFQFHEPEWSSQGAMAAMIQHGALMKTITIEITWTANGKKHSIRPTFAVKRG